MLEQVFIQHGLALGGGESLAWRHRLIVMAIAGRQTAYGITVDPRHVAFEVRDQRDSQGDGTGADLGRESLARRHLGCTPLFMAVHSAATDAQKPITYPRGLAALPIHVSTFMAPCRAMHTFQIRSIGTQTIKLKATLPAADVHTITHNYQHIFRLADYVATVREDGQFDLLLTLEPDNGMATVAEYPVFQIGDIVSRISDDEHEVFGVNAVADLIGVRCIKQDSGGCFSVGDEEWNIPRRYTLLPLPRKHHSPDEEHAEPEQHKGDSNAVNA